MGNWQFCSGQEGWRNKITLPQLMQVFMIVIAAGAIEPLLEEKEKSRNKLSNDELPELTTEELVEAYLSGRELELIALAFKSLVLRTIDTAVTWARQHKEKLTQLVSRMKEVPLLAR